MTTKEYATLFEQTIDINELNGRSFTLGVALYTLLVGGYFKLGSDELMEIKHQLAEYLSYELGTTTDRVYEKLSTRAMAEATDIALLDEIARELSGEAEA